MSGRSSSYNNFRNRVWSKALRNIEGELPKGLSIHHLRHTCASLLIREGASVKAVQEQLGHSSPTVTLGVYAHLFEDGLDDLFERVDRAYMRSHAAPTRPLLKQPKSRPEMLFDLGIRLARPEGFEPPTLGLEAEL